MELQEAIADRKSIRSFKENILMQGEFDKLLWAASKTPSAGGIHPLKFYQKHFFNKELCVPCLNQKCVEEAFSFIVIAADYQKMRKRYGKRGDRYVLMEAGHAAQNICLMATSLGLGAVTIGAFKDAELKKVLGIEEDPLYVIPIGRV